MNKTKYLILGNGIAGLSAAKEIRKTDSQGKITMVSNEPYPSYYRIRLTELLAKQFEEEDVLVHSRDWYEEENISLVLGKIAEKIDIEKNMLILDDGMKITYEKLLIATGSRAFVPPIPGKFKQGVLALRTLKDLKYIRNYIDNRQDITVIGGGLLGLEAALALKKLGKNVNVIEFAPYLLPKQLDEQIANKLKEQLSEEGFNICLGVTVEDIIGENAVEGIKLSDGRKIATDAILFSVGIRPNIDIVRDTPIKHNRGILVDDKLQTNIANIYAAGDVMEYDGETLGLWIASNEQGKIAGANISGQSIKYQKSQPFTMLQIGDIKLFSIGDIKNFNDVREYEDQDKGIHHKVFIRDDKVIGGILSGDTRDMIKLKKAVEENTSAGSFLDKINWDN